MKPDDLPPVDFLRWAVDQPLRDRRMLFPGGVPHQKDAAARLRSAIVHSHAVHFDREASAKLGQLSTLGPDVLLHLAQSARLPWESVLVVMERNSFWSGSYPHLADAEEDPRDADSDLVLMLERAGRPSRVRVHSIVMGHPASRSGFREAMLEPACFEIDTSFETVPIRRDSICDPFRARLLRHVAEIGEKVDPRDKDWTVENFVEAVFSGRDPVDLLLLGREFVPMLTGLSTRGEHGERFVTIGLNREHTRESGFMVDDFDYRVRLASLMAPVPSPYIRLADFTPEDRQGMINEVTPEILGTARTALALLIAFGLSGVSVLTDPRPRGARMVGNRRAPYLATTKIIIDLSKPLAYAHARDDHSESGHHRRRHGVRGFWRYYKSFGRGGAPGCAHHWQSLVPVKPDTPINPDRQVCAHCAARRTWIPEHERGDAGIGFVSHPEVEVIASRRDRNHDHSEPENTLDSQSE